MARHKKKTLQNLSRLPSGKSSKRGSRRPSVPKRGRRSNKPTPVKPRPTNPTQTNKEVHFTLAQDAKINKVIMKKKDRAAPGHSVSQEEIKNGLRYLSEEFGVKYNKVAKRSKFLEQLVEDSSKKLEKLAKSHPNEYGVYRSCGQKLFELVKSQTQSQRQLVDDLEIKEYVVPEVTAKSGNANAFTLEQDLAILKVYDVYAVQKNKSAKRHQRQLAQNMGKTVRLLNIRYKLLKNLSDSQRDHLQIESEQHPMYFAHFEKKDSNIVIKEITRYHLPSHRLAHLWKKQLDDFELQLLKKHLETNPDLGKMSQRLKDFIVVTQGKDQSQINYMVRFLQDFVSKLSQATGIPVHDIKEQLYDENHKDINLEVFRRKLLSLHQLFFYQQYTK